MKKIAVFDLDGTVYVHTWSFEIAKAIVSTFKLTDEQDRIDAATKIAKTRATTESYWIYNATMLTILERVLPKVSPDQLKGIVEQILNEKGSSCYAYSIKLIEEMKAEGRELIAISGSIKDIVEPFAHSLGFDVVISSELEIKDGAYTGKRATQTKSDKHKILQNIVSEHGLTFEDSVGMGDTHRDISFLEILENPIAFNPNAALFDEASKRGWKIVIERKNMIYELSKKQGIYSFENAHPIHDDSNTESLR